MRINTRCNTAADFIALGIRWVSGWDAHGTDTPTHMETLYIFLCLDAFFSGYVDGEIDDRECKLFSETGYTSTLDGADKEALLRCVIC